MSNLGHSVIVFSANQPNLLRQAQQLRWRVYVENLRWLPSSQGPALEMDGYDADAVHFAVLDETGAVVGYARVIGRNGAGFKFEREFVELTRSCGAVVLPGGTVEISRLAIDPIFRDRRDQSRIAIDLYRAVYDWSRRHGVRNWVFVMMDPFRTALREELKLHMKILAVAQGMSLVLVSMRQLARAALRHGLRRALERFKRAFMRWLGVDGTPRVDALTGLCHRESFVAQANREITRARRRGGGLAIILVDLQHNSARFGVGAGDGILRAVAERLAAGVRRGDLAGRYRDSELVVLLRDGDAGSTAAVAERLRSALEGPRVAVKVGVAVLGDHSDATALIGYARLASRMEPAVNQARAPARAG